MISGDLLANGYVLPQPETVPAEPRNRLRSRHSEREVSGERRRTQRRAYNATEECGPRNGVLTAVADYSQQSGQEYYFVGTRVSLSWKSC
jgi:hypothetical protein